MGKEEVIAHRLDLIHREFRLGVGVEISGHVDIVLPGFMHGEDHHVLDVDVGSIDSRALLGQVTDEGGVDALLIN